MTPAKCGNRAMRFMVGFLPRATVEREGSARSASPPSDDNFEIFAGYDHRLIPRTVEPFDQCEQIVGQHCLRLVIEGAERLQEGTVVGLEYVDPVLRRSVAQHEVAL